MKLLKKIWGRRHILSSLGNRFRSCRISKLTAKMNSLYVLIKNTDYDKLNDEKWIPINLVLSDFHYFDENDKYVKELDKFFRRRFYHIPFKYEQPSYEGKKASKIEGGFKIQSSGLENDWAYLYTNKVQGDFKLDFDLMFLSQFKEFQIAFKHQSIFERLRFRIVENKTLVFEVVHAGVFYNHLKSIPCSLDIYKNYHITIIVLWQKYIFAINGKTIMEIFDKHNIFKDGGLAVVAWDQRHPSNINCQITNVRLQIPQ